MSWRLSRTLAVHHGQHVRLRVDDWNTLRRLCPRVPAVASPCTIDGVHLLPWSSPFEEADECDVVVETFACELPEAMVQAMSQRSPAPIWINLEYLSAEDWVASCHRQRSPHPRLALVKHFFFPGFDAGTGGVLREPDLFATRDTFRSGAGPREWIARKTGARTQADTLCVSLFAYPQPQLEALLNAWAGGDRPLRLLVPDGPIVDALSRHFGEASLHAGCNVRDRALRVDILPFLEQGDYDRLLWACDVNFVRGEDSFVRAQWAASPFVWHVYPQQDDAHRVKLAAFSARYIQGLEPVAADAVSGFWAAWNGDGDVARRWPAFVSALDPLRRHAQDWARHLAEQRDLATALIDFCENGV